MTKQALIELRDKVAAGDASDFSMFLRDAHHWECLPTPDAILACKAHSGSLDAAVAFLEAVLPDWSWGVQRTYEGSFLASVGQFTAPNMVKKRFETHADTPARALLLATLSALVEGAE